MKMLFTSDDVEVTPEAVKTTVAWSVAVRRAEVEGTRPPPMPQDVIMFMRVLKRAVEGRSVSDGADTAVRRGTTDSLPEYLFRDEAAKVLRVGVRTFDRFAREGLIEKIRLTPGGRPRFRRDDVLALMRRREETDG